jgi:hypothetical protein
MRRHIRCKNAQKKRSTATHYLDRLNHMENNATLGLILFLGVLAFPLAAIGLPFVDLWYSRNKAKVQQQVTTVRARVDELRESLDAAYEEDEVTVAEESAGESEDD